MQRPFTFQDIKWIKNVKRLGNDIWAYDEWTCDAHFKLHWSVQGEARRPKAGEIILLFQRPDKLGGVTNSLTHLTHLVTPVDDVQGYDSNRPERPYIRLVKVIARANPIIDIPNPGIFNFNKCKWGKTHVIANLQYKFGTSKLELQKAVWNLFSDSFCKNVKIEAGQNLSSASTDGVQEGDKVIRKHIEFEQSKRNAAIIREKKIQALKNGTFFCSVCTFNFFKTYGELGLKFIECHHNNHIKNGPRITQLRDLVLVCSNCHRMLHRTWDGKYHTVQSLRKVMDAQKKKIQVN